MTPHPASATSQTGDIRQADAAGADPREKPRSASPHADAHPPLRSRIETFEIDHALRERCRSIAGFLFQRWWRVRLRGLANVPRRGPVILVGNHSGALPVDAVMLAYALDHEHPESPRRVARVLYDRFIDGIPALADFYKRCGGVPARYATADTLLGRGEVVVIFPEGVGGV